MSKPRVESREAESELDQRKRVPTRAYVRSRARPRVPPGQQAKHPDARRADRETVRDSSETLRATVSTRASGHGPRALMESYLVILKIRLKIKSEITSSARFYSERSCRWQTPQREPQLPTRNDRCATAHCALTARARAAAAAERLVPRGRSFGVRSARARGPRRVASAVSPLASGEPEVTQPTAPLQRCTSERRDSRAEMIAPRVQRGRVRVGAPPAWLRVCSYGCPAVSPL